jgi:hypothetical protein
MTIGTGHLGFFDSRCLIFTTNHKSMLVAGSDEQAGGGAQSDEQVSRIGMSRPHPSLERRENGPFRLMTTY